ncbi:unnamed protein product [Oncorhynchus mykiss]|uniref:RING-type E3 ubiquitin transferase n=1 Tax=Oncorhynchus mykiss TaxID=8022 RepID=A0A060W9J1_ONCMY|nr:unnamed protein product [Oncorhynchus mykiss]
MKSSYILHLICSLLTSTVCWKSRLMRRKGTSVCGAGSLTNPLLTPCLCSGSLQYIHHDCLKRWIQTKIQSGTTLSAVKTCELCKGSLTLDLDDFDMEEFYQRHGQTQVEQTSPELYMLLILRQRFSELLQVAQSRSNTVSRVGRNLHLIQWYHLDRGEIT